MLSLRVQSVVLGASIAFAATASDVRAQAPFYKGKRLTVLINFAAGGPADIEGRIFAKYLVKHIDGAPSLVVQNMDGAGGLIGAQYLGEIAPNRTRSAPRIAFVMEGSPVQVRASALKRASSLHVLRDGELSIRSRSPVEAAGAR